jgi:hypothetical protein
LSVSLFLRDLKLLNFLLKNFKPKYQHSPLILKVLEILTEFKRETVMADKNAEQLKSYYTELAKLAPGQDWERILKTAKKSIPNLDAEKQFSHD